MERNNIKKLALYIICIIFIFIIFFNITIPKGKIQFNHDSEDVEINSQFDPITFIKSVEGDKNNIKIQSNVNKDVLGKYDIKYILDKDEYTLTVNVVDTKAPEFDIQDLYSEVGVNVQPEEFVKNIKDQTKTTVRYKESYSFDKAGKQKITIIVSDEANNETSKEALLTLVEDKEKPVLEGIKDIKVSVGMKINYLSGIKAKDNLDPNPKVEVDSSQVNNKKIGQYEIVYTVTDRSGNRNEYKQKVNIVKDKVIVKIPQSKEKIVYLTFDDGPSENTKKILDILDHYDAKATFFVTGNGKKYNHLIKEACDKGHTIALHTYSHNYKKVYSSLNAYFNDLNKVGNMVKNIIGYVPKYIRFPGGSSNTISKKYCKGIMSKLVVEVQKRGYQFYDWNGDTTDASGNNVAVSKLIKNATVYKSKNIMILAHDTKAKSTTVDALPKIIEYYKKKGYKFKGIDDSTFTPHHGVNN